ncbi:sigma-70 family RNA polymerase sigma factor [Bacteroides fragilis]|nr:sigma-70 family RNA polymerase sigma factor [Bacteroides fragilis]
MDTESFKREFLPYHRKLYCVAYRLLENAADAEDLVQEAYLKLWDKREGLSVISNPEAFSVTLVKNMCFDLLRSGKYVLSRQSVELSAAQDVFQPDNLEDKLNLLIDEMAEKEQHFFRPNNSKNSWHWIGGVAATILLLIGIGYGIDNLSKNVCPPTPQDTFSDPEEAYRMLQATLLEISANLNYGLNEVKESQIDMRKIHQEVRNEIKK